nr:hypothetical protein [Bacilli bacterium]
MLEKWNYFLAGLIGATIIYAFIILSIVFIDVIKDKREESIKVKETGSFSCEVFENVRNTFDSNIIINNGKLYNISLDLKYSNEQNCKEISDINITKVVNNYYISDDGKVYTIDENGIKEYHNNGKFPSYMMGEEIVMAHSYGSSSEYKYYVLKTDGKIYDVNFTREFHFEDGVGTYKYNLAEEKVYKEFEDEKVKSFDVVEGNVDFVFSDKNVYINKVTNMECYQYADVECIYELSLNDVMKASMEDVSYINHLERTIKYISANKVYSFEV